MSSRFTDNALTVWKVEGFRLSRLQLDDFEVLQFEAGCSYLVLHSLGEGNCDAELFIWNGCSIPKHTRQAVRFLCSEVKANLGRNCVVVREEEQGFESRQFKEAILDFSVTSESLLESFASEDSVSESLWDSAHAESMLKTTDSGRMEAAHSGGNIAELIGKARHQFERAVYGQMQTLKYDSAAATVAVRPASKQQAHSVPAGTQAGQHLPAAAPASQTAAVGAAAGAEQLHQEPQPQPTGTVPTSAASPATLKHQPSRTSRPKRYRTPPRLMALPAIQEAQARTTQWQPDSAFDRLSRLSRQAQAEQHDAASSGRLSRQSRQPDAACDRPCHDRMPDRAGRHTVRQEHGADHVARQMEPPVSAPAPAPAEAKHKRSPGVLRASLMALRKLDDWLEKRREECYPTWGPQSK